MLQAKQIGCGHFYAQNEKNAMNPFFSGTLHRRSPSLEEGAEAADGRLPLHRVQQRSAGRLQTDHPQRQL
jgi:hypothetical protein